jgi:fucose permease
LKRTVLLAGASFGVLGACLTLPGTLLPILLDALHLRLVEAGSMFAVQPAGYVLAVLAAGRLIERAGMRRVLTAGLVAAGAGWAGFGLASTWALGAVMMLASGVGFGLMEVATNTLLITRGGARRANLLNFAHLFFGIGSALAPLLATRAVAAGVSWRVVFVVAGAATAAVALGWSAIDDAHAAAAAPAAQAARPARRPLRSRYTLALAVLLAVYLGAETGIGAWLTKYLVGVRGMTLTEAGAALSLYWLGLSAGRLVLTVYAHRVRDERLLVVLASLTLAALVTALLVSDRRAAVASFGVVGLGLSGIFPAVMALGGRRHLDDAARVASLLVAGAGVGGIVLPWVMSAIAEWAGVAAGMAFYAATVAVMVGLTIVIARAAPSAAQVQSAQLPVART